MNTQREENYPFLNKWKTQRNPPDIEYITAACNKI